MADTAIVRYQCSNCQTELEQEGYIALDATDQQVGSLFDLTVNKVICPQCSYEHYLNLPLFYHDGANSLLICYMPGVAEMDAAQLAEAMRIPYERLMMEMAGKLGLELPEPDPAAFPIGQEHMYTPFSALTAEQSEALYPAYLLRPMVVDNLEVVAAVAQAVKDGMAAEEVLEDMTRLQLINAVSNATDPIERRKILHRFEPYLNESLYEVIDTLLEQMQQEGSAEMVERLNFVRHEVQRYKNAQQARRKSSQ